MPANVRPIVNIVLVLLESPPVLECSRRLVYGPRLSQSGAISQNIEPNVSPQWYRL
jgi:hypothetical protein